MDSLGQSLSYVWLSWRNGLLKHARSPALEAASLVLRRTVICDKDVLLLSSFTEAESLVRLRQGHTRVVLSRAFSR